MATSGGSGKTRLRRTNLRDESVCFNRADFWDKDDYDVRLGDRNGPVVGRIMRHPQTPEAQPWFWTITAREQPPSVYNRGYAASREQAMRYFKARYVPR